MKNVLDSSIEQCNNYNKQIQEDEKKLEVVNQFQNLARIKELIAKLDETQKKIDVESVAVLKAISQRQLELYGTISQRSKELGFANVETYHKFKEELEKFQLRFHDFSSISKKYQTRMENYSTQTQTHVKHFQNEINSEKSQELRNLINDKKLRMLLAKDPNLTNPDVSEVSLFQLVEKYIPLDEKNFGLQELKEVCKNEDTIIDIICQIETKATQRTTSQYIKLFLRDFELKLNSIEKSIEDIEQKSYKVDDDIAFQHLKEQISELEQEKKDGKRDDEEKDEWDSRQKELKKNIDQKKSEMKNRKTELGNEEVNSKKEMKALSEKKEKTGGGD